MVNMFSSVHMLVYQLEISSIVSFWLTLGLTSNNASDSSQLLLCLELVSHIGKHNCKSAFFVIGYIWTSSGKARSVFSPYFVRTTVKLLLNNNVIKFAGS